jgi:hypothetical protein
VISLGGLFISWSFQSSDNEAIFLKKKKRYQKFFTNFFAMFVLGAKKGVFSKFKVVPYLYLAQVDMIEF